MASYFVENSEDNHKACSFCVLAWYIIIESMKIFMNTIQSMEHVQSKVLLMQISLENGKDHLICSKFLKTTKEKYKPRYGCGKCQINVPCESFVP